MLLQATTPNRLLTIPLRVTTPRLKNTTQQRRPSTILPRTTTPKLTSIIRLSHTTHLRRSHTPVIRGHHRIDLITVYIS
jgi:hypothetical protein